jgi:hypothetical protein
MNPGSFVIIKYKHKTSFYYSKWLVRIITYDGDKIHYDILFRFDDNLKIWIQRDGKGSGFISNFRVYKKYDNIQEFVEKNFEHIL